MIKFKDILKEQFTNFKPFEPDWDEEPYEFIPEQAGSGQNDDIHSFKFFSSIVGILVDDGSNEEIQKLSGIRDKIDYLVHRKEVVDYAIAKRDGKGDNLKINNTESKKIISATFKYIKKLSETDIDRFIKAGKTLTRV